MPERPKKILTELIQVVQLNVNRSPDVMTIMQQEYIHNTDILLYQEPAFSKSTLPQHLFLTPKILGFTTILPCYGHFSRLPIRADPNAHTANFAYRSSRLSTSSPQYASPRSQSRRYTTRSYDHDSSLAGDRPPRYSAQQQSVVLTPSITIGLVQCYHICLWTLSCFHMFIVSFSHS